MNGLIIQWIFISSGWQNGMSISFPIAFLKRPFGVTSQFTRSNYNSGTTAVTYVTPSNFIIYAALEGLVTSSDVCVFATGI